MQLRALVLALLLAALAFTLASVLMTRDGVGALEYVVGGVLLALLLLALARASRRALGRI
jgi:uncharacterized membrane protein